MPEPQSASLDSLTDDELRAHVDGLRAQRRNTTHQLRAALRELDSREAVKQAVAEVEAMSDVKRSAIAKELAKRGEHADG